jgi:hypothetical protein
MAANEPHGEAMRTHPSTDSTATDTSIGGGTQTEIMYRAFVKVMGKKNAAIAIVVITVLGFFSTIAIAALAYAKN